LELFFDLCFVVAIAQAAAQLHHAEVEHHAATGVVSFLMVFFAIWWAWMNLTWFASAYDSDDTWYRLAVFVQIAGVLVLAASIPAVFKDRLSPELSWAT
jgi:low temperature requirement protein LtrA